MSSMALIGRIPGNSAVFFRVMLLKDYDVQLNPLSPRSRDDSKRHRKRVLPLISNFTSFRFSLVTVTTATDSGIPCLLQIIHGELDIVEARTSMVNLDLSDEEGGIDLSRQTDFRFAQKRVN